MPAFKQIKTVSGHLTACDKRALLVILNAGHQYGETKRKHWAVEGNTVWTTETVMEWSGPRKATYKAEFEAKE